MFEYDVTIASHFDRRVDGEEAYNSYLSRVQINPLHFPFKVDAKRLYRGKPVIFKASSWGCYKASDFRWVVFIAYVCSLTKHTVQYRWFCNENGMPEGEPLKFEWIN